MLRWAEATPCAAKSAADRVLDHLAPLLAISPARRPRKDTVYIVDGTLVPTRDRSVAASSENWTPGAAT